MDVVDVASPTSMGATILETKRQLALNSKEQNDGGTKGVFLVTTIIAFVSFERDLSVKTEFQPSHEGVSEVSERAREQSERAKRA